MISCTHESAYKMRRMQMDVIMQYLVRAGRMGTLFSNIEEQFEDTRMQGVQQNINFWLAACSPMEHCLEDPSHRNLEAHVRIGLIMMTCFEILAHPGAKTLDVGTTLAPRRATNDAQKYRSFLCIGLFTHASTHRMNNPSNYRVFWPQGHRIELN